MMAKACLFKGLCHHVNACPLRKGIGSKGGREDNRQKENRRQRKGRKRQIEGKGDLGWTIENT
jgi:hypothetical protein